MRDLDVHLVNAICKTHTEAYLGVIKSMVYMGIPLEEIRHDFERPYDDEFITWNNRGWHITKEWDGDGKISVCAEPGEFVVTNIGRKWIKRITAMHSVLGNNARSDRPIQ